GAPATTIARVQYMAGGVVKVMDVERPARDAEIARVYRSDAAGDRLADSDLLARWIGEEHRPAVLAEGVTEFGRLRVDGAVNVIDRACEQLASCEHTTVRVPAIPCERRALVRS